MRHFLATLICCLGAALIGMAQEPTANSPPAKFQEEPLEIENENPLLIPELPAAIGKRLAIEVQSVTISKAHTNLTARDVLTMGREQRAKAVATTSIIAMDNQFACAWFTEMAQAVVGYVNIGPAREPIYQWMNIGTQLMTKARLENDGRATIQIYFERSVLSTDKNKPDAVIQHRARSTVNIGPEEPVLLTLGPSETSSADATYFVLRFKEAK